MLLLNPPGDLSPIVPTCYGSPARPWSKREVMLVREASCHEQLLQRLEQANGTGDEEVEADEEEAEVGPEVVQSWKQSAYWSKEVDERVGLGGADPYGLLELEDKRWRASAEELRKAYRRLVLTHHPDKKASASAGTAEVDSPASKSKKEKGKAEPKENEKVKEADANLSGKENARGSRVLHEDDTDDSEEEEEAEDADFKLLSRAWELLGNPETRRAFDSVDYMNDNMPQSFRPKPERGPDYFFRVFGPPFRRQSKFSVEQPVPQLGDADTPYEDVVKFYRFWQNFSSWRDFALLAEHDLTQAEDREERRWMTRMNKNQSARVKKEEIGRLQGMVELAYEHDPRVQKHREEVAMQKQRAKEAREAALQAEREKANAEAAAAKAAQEEQDAAAAVDRQAKADERASVKREKEKQRSALKKARKDLKALGSEDPWKDRVADLEVVAAALSLEQILELQDAMQSQGTAAATAALGAALKQVLI